MKWFKLNSDMSTFNSELMGIDSEFWVDLIYTPANKVMGVYRNKPVSLSVSLSVCLPVSDIHVAGDNLCPYIE